MRRAHNSYLKSFSYLGIQTSSTMILKMDIDLELYRHEVRVSNDPLVRLSAIDINPEHAQGTMVFIHGYGGKATQWQYQLQEFGLTHRVIGLDLRGHGDSNDPESSYSMEEIQADLVKALDILNISDKIIIVGHSFGGAIAAQFAHANQDKVEHLILIATTGEFNLDFSRRLLLKIPYAVMRLIAPFTKNWLGASPSVMKRMYTNSVSQWSGWTIFRNLEVPTLVIRGHRDRVFASREFEETSRAIPGSQDLDVGASGHMVMLERRQAVNRAIHSFIAARPASWRERTLDPETDISAALLAERPWLSHYESGVPHTISLPNVPLHLLLRSAVRRYPLRTAILFEGGRLTYRRLNHESNRFANALIARGIRKGDRVMLLMPNLPQLVIAYFGVLKAGAAAVFGLPSTEEDELLRQIADVEARILVTINQFGSLSQRALNETSLEHVIFSNAARYLPIYKRLALGLNPKRKRKFSGKIARGPNMSAFSRALYTHDRKNPEVEVSPEDLAVIQFTGGTTQQPKGVMITHRNLVANNLQNRHWNLEAREGKEKILCVIPFSHSYGLSIALNGGIALGATLILKSSFETEDILKTIRNHKPTLFPGVPAMFLALSSFPGVRKYKISSIRACLSGSTPLPVEVQEAFEKLTRGRLVEGYGLTEASPTTHANPLFGKRKIGSIGIPLPSTEARIVSLTEPSQVMPVEQIGELAVRGPQIMRGYWNDEAATKECLISDGWLLTGDVALMDNEGYFRLVARKSDMWYPEKPGEPAFPRDVEEVLFEIPQVKEAVVVGIANKPVAFVIAAGKKPTSESIIAYCKRRLPPELVPRLIIFAEDFPRSFIGKVLRKELAKYYEKNYAQTS